MNESDPPPAFCGLSEFIIVECSTNAISIRISEQNRGVGLFVDSAPLHFRSVTQLDIHPRALNHTFGGFSQDFRTEESRVVC